MSSDTQNDLLEAAASLLLRKIKAVKLNETLGTYFTPIADEYKGELEQELIAACVRYVHRRMRKERAVGLWKL